MAASKNTAVNGEHDERAPPVQMAVNGKADELDGVREGIGAAIS